jgi:ribosomal protein L18E/predicted transport protein
MSRLIQSTESIQCFYSEIKNHVLSYKGIKARESWNYEAFNKGRTQLVKLNIKGKTLIVNLNLDPKEFNINKYHFIDCSDKPKFAKVPMMMKVRSARALKYTLELVDELMAKYEIEKGELPTVDYRMPYETTEELAKKGLVKVILPAGVTLSEDMTVVHVNVSELIESGANVKTTEQLIGENVDLEQAPVEAVAEKFEPVIEILEDGTVHADAEYADQLISDEEAEAQIEVVAATNNVKRTGKMGEINLDTICDNFDDGETVDVDALKAKRLVSPKIGRVKVLARGIMYKRLTVKASKFSIQAVKMITLAGGKAELEE